MDDLGGGVQKPPYFWISTHIPHTNHHLMRSIHEEKNHLLDQREKFTSPKNPNVNPWFRFNKWSNHMKSCNKRVPKKCQELYSKQTTAKHRI